MVALATLTESPPPTAPTASTALFVDPSGRRFAMETAPRTVGLLFSAPEAGQAILHRLIAAAVPMATAPTAAHAVPGQIRPGFRREPGAR
jgi:hypothetical protein